MNSHYEELATGIVMQAVKDWRSSVTKLKKCPRYEPAQKMKEDCESFFRSAWFQALTGADGTYILLKLKKEAGL